MDGARGWAGTTSSIGAAEMEGGMQGAVAGVVGWIGRLEGPASGSSKSNLQIQETNHEDLFVWINPLTQVKAARRLTSASLRAFSQSCGEAARTAPAVCLVLVATTAVQEPQAAHAQTAPFGVAGL